MASTSRLIIGIILIAFSFIMFVVAFFEWVALIYGVVALILGIVIILNKAEDKIERRKDIK